ncbi:MAG: DRTGG domain-containing protein [Firmicutes bacterium]|nr:DRTGG domain-containing protein [Bacillota bacterium]MDI6705687.1 DRTGG domain-containing protein [Bacillota bacterium]
MTVKEMAGRLNLKPAAGLDAMENEVAGAYVCDLLSWVMAHAGKGSAWVTIQAHVNIVAVACLLDLACIIVCEGVEVDADTLEKANDEGMPVLTTTKDAYSICCGLKDLGI